MTRSLLTLLLLCSTGCNERPSTEPAGGPRQDYVLAAPSVFPTAQEIEHACSEAVRIAARNAPGFGHPTYYDYPVRDPRCRWTEEDPRTADCRFDRATIEIEFPTEEQREAALRRMGQNDWEPFRATLVRVPSRWVAPAGCDRSRGGEGS